MSNIKIDLIHAFGSTCSQKYKNCIGVCDEQKNEAKIVFPVGKSLAKKTIDRAQIWDYQENTDRIQNIFVLPTRAHVAVAYQPYNSQIQTIKIYSFKREDEPITIKIFHENEKIGQIKLMFFSPSQPKFMCVLLGEPHSKLLFVDTFKNKPLAESAFTLKDIDHLTICPTNSHLICVSGGSSIKLFKVEEYTFKPLEEIKRIPKGRRITTHSWYKKKIIIAATDKSQILILEESRLNVFQIKQEYHNVFNEVKFDRLLVTAICTFSKGFILGSNTGKFCLWTKKEDSNIQGEEALQLSRKWSTTEERASEVTNIQISSKEDLITISLANNDIATLYINELIPQVSDLLNNLSDKEIIFEYLYKGFHNNKITGMDICEQRPLIATCSQLDSTIRIWNYKNYGCKLLRMFYFKLKEDFQTDKPLITLAFHPSGYYLAVACIDKLRFFHVLNNQLRPYRQLGVKNAHIAKFSRGGHLLAVCFPLREEANVNHIKIFNALTLEEIIILKDHACLIKNIQFKKQDECLLSVGEEGSLMQWRIYDWVKVKSVVKKEMKYSSSIYWHGRNSIIAFGTFKGKHYLQQHGENGSLSQLQLDFVVVSMVEIVIGKEKALLLSLSNGKLVVFGGLQRPLIMDVKNYHINTATNVLLSPCGKFVITSGEDCVVFIFRIYHELDGIIQEEQHSNIVVDDFLADVVLINRKEIEKVNEKQMEFNKVISSLSKKLKQFAQEGLGKHNKRMLQVQLQKNRIIDDMNYRIQRLKNQVSQLRSKSSIEIEDLDQSHIKKAQQLQRSYQQKINFQIEKYFQLEQQLIQIKIIHKKEMEELAKLEEQQIFKLKDEFQNKFKESEQIYSSSKTEAERAINIFEARLKQVEEQQEEQMRQIQAKKHKFKLQTAASLQELFDKQFKLKKDHNKFSEQRNEQKDKNEQRLHNKKKVEKEVQQARQKLKEMNMQYNQKLQILKTKQKRIAEFQDKITQLQKKKHILSYKGTQMKKAMEPKEFQIDKLKSDLIKLKKQFQISLERKQKSILALQKNEKQKISLQRIVEDEKGETNRSIETIDQILSDMFHCLQAYKKVNDVKIFYKEFIKLYHRYINKQDKNEVVSQSKGIQELTKQVLHLEKSLYQMNKGNQKNVKRKNDQINKRIKQNTELVTNLNEIKKENKELVLKIKSKRDEIEKLRQSKNSLMAQCKNIDSNTYKMFLQDDFIESQKNMNDKSRGSAIQNSASKLSLINNPKDQLTEKKNIHKLQCQMISQIEFTAEKLHKVEYLIKEMKERVKKHLVQFRCQAFIFEDQDLSEIKQP